MPTAEGAQPPRDWAPGPKDAITDVPGIRVGHWTDRGGSTGCTVVLCEDSTFAAVDARGGAPGTRETDALASANVVRRCHAIVLSGGSAFGLAAATGVVAWLRQHDVGFETKGGRVPVVPSAVLYDLTSGKPGAFPDVSAGYLAAKRATRGQVARGNVGAGTGATIAKLMGMERALKGGVGTASVTGPRGMVVGAIVAVNALGHVFDPGTGALIAGPRGDDGTFVPLAEAMHRHIEQMDTLAENTTLICVATNAKVDHHHVQRLAYQAHDGLARVVMPAHAFGDGDVAFAVTMGTLDVEPHDTLALGIMTIHAVERALLNAVRSAKSAFGVPSVNAWPGP